MYVAHVKAKSDEYVGLEEDQKVVQAIPDRPLDDKVPKCGWLGPRPPRADRAGENGPLSPTERPLL